MASTSALDGVIFPMSKGPFQNNGAAPWYADLSIGTPGQNLKVSIDSGTNITWVTSTLCPPDQCQHYSGGRFDVSASSTFSFTDCLDRPFSFGPWGTMQVQSGVDVLQIPGGSTVPSRMFFASFYDGDQFSQLDWDGGIGIPSSSAYVEGRSSFLFQELLVAGLVSPELPYVAFDWDPATKQGVCQMGGYDASKAQGPSLYLPWMPYTVLSGTEYLWTADLASWKVGNQTLAENVMLSLDTGSSQFKGDDDIMNQTLALIAQQGAPDVTLDFPDGGQIVFGSDVYNITIEAGPDQGKVVPQFKPLGLPGLGLVGSLLMDYFYTVHEYKIVNCQATTYSLAPVGMHLFNYSDRPQLITKPSPHAPGLGSRTAVSGMTSFGRRS